MSESKLLANRSPEEIAAIESIIKSEKQWDIVVKLLEQQYNTLNFTQTGDKKKDIEAWMLLYTAVHNFHTNTASSGAIELLVGNTARPGGLTRFIRGRLLYAQLKLMIEGNLLLLTDEAPCTEAEFLDFVQNAERDFMDKAALLHAQLRYFNRNWVIWVNDNHKGRAYDDVFEIHRRVLSTEFPANVQAKVRRTAFKFSLKRGPLNLDSHPLIRELVTSFVDPGRALLPTFPVARRPIWLVSRRLGQFAWTRSSCRSKGSPTDGLSATSTGSQASQIAAFTATFDHWGLLIGPASSSTGNPVLTLRGSFLCELNNDEGVVRGFSAAAEEVGLAGFTLCGLWGYTTRTDAELEVDVKEVIEHMPPVYNFLGNNCQAFCEMLLMHIKCADTVTELHSDYMKLPPGVQEKIMRRHCIDKLPMIYEQMSTGEAPPLPSMDKIKIPPAKTLAIWALVLSAITVLSACVLWGIHVGPRVEFGALMQCLYVSWDCLRRLPVSKLFQEWRSRPHGQFWKDFDTLIGTEVANFYQEREGGSQRLIELPDWEPQVGNTQRSMSELRRAGRHLRAGID